VVLNMSNVSRRQMTKELLAQNRHLEIILESIPEGIMEGIYPRPGVSPVRLVKILLMVARRAIWKGKGDEKG
jgi:hypothetical protein